MQDKGNMILRCVIRLMVGSHDRLESLPKAVRAQITTPQQACSK